MFACLFLVALKMPVTLLCTRLAALSLGCGAGCALAVTWAPGLGALRCICVLSSCTARAQLLCSTWDPSSPSRDPSCVSPAPGCGLSVTGPPEQSPLVCFLIKELVGGQWVGFFICHFDCRFLDQYLPFLYLVSSNSSRR